MGTCISHDTETWCFSQLLQHWLLYPCSQCIHKINHSYLWCVSSIFGSSLEEQLTTKSTNWSKLVVCAMCCLTRKWVHLRRAFIAFLLFNLSLTLRSCWTIDPCYLLTLSASTSALQDVKWTSVCECVLIFSIAFFQLVKGFVKGFIIQAPPVRSRDLPCFLQTLQKAPCKFSSNSSHGKVPSQCLLYWSRWLRSSTLAGPTVTWTLFLRTRTAWFKYVTVWLTVTSNRSYWASTSKIWPWVSHEESSTLQSESI